MKILIAMLVAIGVLTASASLLVADEWRGFVYPNKNDLTSHVAVSGTFETYEQCRAAAYDTASHMPDGRWAFECGLNCELRGNTTMLVCEATRDD